MITIPTHHYRLVAALTHCLEVRHTWNIDTLPNTSKTKIPAIALLNSKSNDKTTTINEINHYFSGIGKKMADSISGSMVTPNTHDIQTITRMKSFALFETDDFEVGSLILNLKNESATGWDGIPAKFL